MNRELALKLMEDSKAVDDAEAVGKKSAAKLLMKSNILNDSRFKDLFVNPNFQIDKSSEEFRYFFFLSKKRFVTSALTFLPLSNYYTGCLTLQSHVWTKSEKNVSKRLSLKTSLNPSR